MNSCVDDVMVKASVHRKGTGMTNRTPSTDVNLTAFDLLQALTGEVPCYASPNWNVSEKKEERPTQGPSKAKEQVEITCS